MNDTTMNLEERLERAKEAFERSSILAKGFHERLDALVRDGIEEGIMPVVIAMTLGNQIAHIAAVLAVHRAEFEDRAPTENDAREVTSALFNAMHSDLGDRVRDIDAGVQAMKSAQKEEAA